MMSLVKQTVQSMLQETALDMTRLGQRLAGLPLTPRPIPFITGNVQLPHPDPTATVDPSAVLTGMVRIRRNAAIGANTVIRGDTAVVDIGRQTKLGGK